MKKAISASLVALAAAGVLTACESNPSKPDASSDASTATEPAKPAAPAKPAVKPTPAWMNSKGEVIDPTEVESGYGTQVKVGEWEGEITGKPAPKSRFTKLKIGMPMVQVTNLLGQPSDQGAYITGKAWIPFYYGSDRHRFELVYKGQGRLIFAGGSIGNFTNGHLIWIIHSAAQGASR